MKTECSIVRDLLPLYAEDMVSEDTRAFIDGHLEHCEECRRQLSEIKEPETVRLPEEEVPLTKLRSGLRRKKTGIIVLTVLISLVLILSAVTAFTSPSYYRYEDGLITVTENANGTVTLDFRDDVRFYNCDMFTDPDGMLIYTISAYTTALEEWLGRVSMNAPLTIPTDGPEMLIYYTENTGSDSILLYTNSDTQIGFGMQVLPRLALGYYVILAAVFLAILVILRLVMRKNERMRSVLNTLILVPVSYIASHLIVSGFDSRTYSMVSDFAFIVVISFVIFAALYTLLRLVKKRRDN